MGSSLSDITSSPTTLAILTLTTCVAVSVAFSNTKMSTKEKAIALAGPPNLPEPYVTGSFTNTRHQSIFTVHLPRTDTTVPAKAMFILVHGIAEHCIRPGYLKLYKALSDEGIDVYAMDHHGHGRSDGEPRGYAEQFSHYIDDIVEFVGLRKSTYTVKGEDTPPIILMGQSMGGLITGMAAARLKSDINGIILTSPAMGVEYTMEMKVQRIFSPVINQLLPKARIVDAVDPKDLSRNEEAVKAYVADPLCPVGKLVARTCIDFDKTFDIMKGKRGEITVPVLVLHGTDDKTTSTNASLDFFNGVGTPVEKKKYLRLHGMYHELFEEPETDQILEWVLTFVKSGGQEFGKVEGEEKDGVVDVKFS